MDLIPGTALALMPLPLVIQYCVEAGKLTLRPSQRICVRASRPGLNKVPFQMDQLFTNHKTNSYVGCTLKDKKAISLPDFGSCFVMLAKRRTSRGPVTSAHRAYLMSSFLVSAAVGRFTSVMCMESLFG